MYTKRSHRTALFVFAVLSFLWGAPHAFASDYYAWTNQQGAGSGTWVGINYSSDGSVISSASFEGDVHVSTTSGATWTDETAAGNRDWATISASADGSLIAAAPSNGTIYVSTTTGATWTATPAGTHFWQGITVAGNGSVIAAAASGGDIYVSTTTGATWTDETSVGTSSWQGMTSSYDGSLIAAVTFGNGIYVSTTTGATWTRSNAPNEEWLSISASRDGSHLIAASYADDTETVTNGNIWVSSDYGLTWTQLTNISPSGWYAVAISPDGTHYAAASGNSYGSYYQERLSNLYTSIDAGAHWLKEDSPGLDAWNGVAFTQDGKRLAAIGGRIWTGLQASPQSDEVTTLPLAPLLNVHTHADQATRFSLSSNQSNGISSIGYNYAGPGVATTTATFSGGETVTIEGSIAGLSCNTTYSIWSFATNSIGTVTGTPQSFATPACSSASASPSGSVHSSVQSSVSSGTLATSTTITLLAQSPQDIVATSTTTMPVLVPRMDLHVGMSGESVLWLQQFLIAKSVGPAASALKKVGASSYFGARTKAALSEYQKSVSIAHTSGYFGAITRAYIQDHLTKH